VPALTIMEDLQVLEERGGQLRDVILCQGDYDVVALFEVPDAEAANAIALAAVGPGT
jgi:uncharacterized protein with GYD domain